MPNADLLWNVIIKRWPDEHEWITIAQIEELAPLGSAGISIRASYEFAMLTLLSNRREYIAHADSAASRTINDEVKVTNRRNGIWRHYLNSCVRKAGSYSKVHQEETQNPKQIKNSQKANEELTFDTQNDNDHVNQYEIKQIESSTLPHKEKFLVKEFWILSWNASVQRALKYAENVSPFERSQFRDAIIVFCEENIIPCYKRKVTESKHIENIIKTRDYASEMNTVKVCASPYNIGITQKLINLQLKYLWCAGYIERPPHCPVDRIILSKTKLKGKMNWTHIDSIDDYRNAISAIRDVAGSQHIADWELEAFGRRSL